MYKLFGFNFRNNRQETPKEDLEVKPPKVKKEIIPVPGVRSSRPTLESSFIDITKKTTFINSDFITQYIPIIRKLSWVNQDVGLVINDMVRLTNTGFSIKFDPSTPPELQERMKSHLKEKQKFWGDGVDGINGLINKMVAQIWISGALSNEWVVNKNKDGVSNNALVNPETIVWSWNKKKLRFEPYQKQNYETGQRLGEKNVKLNPATFKYFGLNGDTELPYGIPPFLTALNSLSTQSDMDQNIRFIMKQIGLLGFFESLMEKPDQDEGENEEQYKSRLTGLLAAAKENILAGIGEGVVVGYKDDHEFNFNATTKNLNGVSDIYNQNQRGIANGLKTAPEMMGIGGGGAETGINIIFTKMLSQLQNIQMIVAENLTYGFSLELMLAGFRFKHLTVEFKPSTISDDLKSQQAQEYKIRNINNKYLMGIIGQQQVANELGYDKADNQEPRGSISGGGGTQEDKDKDTKNDSAKKTREKDKTQPKRKDQKKATAEDLINRALDLLNGLD